MVNWSQAILAPLRLKWRTLGTRAANGTGIHDAIARKLNEKTKLLRNAIAEAIINKVRKTILRDQLTDPRFHGEMSKLLDDLVKQSQADAAAYEEFLKRAEQLVQRLARKEGGNHPAMLNGLTSTIVLFDNLGSIPVTTFQCPADDDVKAKLALDIDRAMREHAPAGWRGDDTREKQVLKALARAYAISKLGWIREQQAKLQTQAREAPRRFVERESHYLWGRRPRPLVVEGSRYK